ncbi:MAG: hypothetical protein ABFD46_10955 [Armatimonadota bacterium]
MQKLRRFLERDSEEIVNRDVVEEFPIKIAENWDVIVNSANLMAEVIDRHLDFESKLQGRELRPVTLCPEQRVSLISDLSAV